MRSRPSRPTVQTLLGVVLFVSLVAAQSGRRDTERARLPKFDQKSDIFFENAFVEALIGNRPDFSTTAPTTDSRNLPQNDSDEGPQTDDYPWSRIISAEMLEDEIKSLQQAVDRIVTTPGKFSSGDYKVARREFTSLAMLFAVVGQFDDEIRWKEYAPTARDLMAHTAANAKVGTIQVYNEAKQRKAELSDIVRGGKLSVNKDASTKPDWSKTCARAPLMQRLETSYQERIQPWLSSSSEFRKQRDALQHEASLVAVLAEVLMQEGMEDGDEEDYAAFCTMLRDAAAEISRAARDQDFQAARSAKDRATKSCTQCHESYRA